MNFYIYSSNGDILANKIESLFSREIVLCQDKEELADKAARTFAGIIKDKPGDTTCSVALSGGSTPAVLYKRLMQNDMRESINWQRIGFYVSDERCVAHESPESNWGNADRQLLQHLHLSEQQLHPTRMQEIDAEKSARLYEEEILNSVPKGPAGFPRFDIVFLGMGPDGHTASLFPGTTAVQESKSLVVRNHVPKFNADRISFTFPLIDSAANVIFLVSGEDKAEVLQEVMENRGGHPAGSVAPGAGKLTWFVDRAAASKLQL